MKAKHQLSFTNEELVAGISNNDDHIIEYLYFKGFPVLEYHVLNLGGTTAEAHEVYQDAIASTWINIRRGQFIGFQGDSLVEYVHKLAYHKWIDRADQSPPIVESEYFAGISRESPRERVKRLETESRARIMERTYHGMGEFCRLILNKYYFRKKSLSEISQEMGHADSKLRIMKYRCMMNLRNVLLALQPGKKEAM